VKKTVIILGLIIALSFVARLYKINNPIADWHSWRQADTAAVARNFYQDGYNPFIPKYDDMSGVAENPIPNVNRYRFVEFPIYNSLVYFGYLINGGVNEVIARLITVFISLGSLIFIFLLTRKYFGELTGFLAALLFGVLPYSIYYSRVILPDPLMVFFSLGMLYFLDLWILENKRYQLIWGVILMAGALLTKPMSIFYLLPLIYPYYQKEKKLWPIPRRYLIILLGFLPFIGWRLWINQHPEGIPASKWLLNGNRIRFKPAFWRWIVGDRLDREILSVSGVFLFLLGLIKRPLPKEGNLLHFLALSSFLYLIVFATGNVQHDYYQILIIPALVIFTARGAVLLMKGGMGFVSRIWTIPLTVFLLIIMLYFSWLQVKGLFQINNDSIIKAGVEANKILPKEAVVVAPYQGDTSFLYQTDRHGWAFELNSIDYMISNFGVTSYVSVTKDAKTEWIMKKFTVLEDNPEFVIVDLTHQNPSFNPFNNPEPPNP
jgi:4-amino-4-deoxy-L-arabinose transferase-like glycosyltransferase